VGLCAAGTLRTRDSSSSAADDELRLERLGQHAVTAGVVGAGLIPGSNAPVNRTTNMREPRRPPHVLRDLIAVLAGHADVGEHDVGR
jgi:hypothetical protein